MVPRLAFLGAMVILAQGIAAANCRPGYVGSDYYRDSSCREFLIPRAYPGDIFYFSGPMVYGAPLGQTVIVFSPQIPSWYFRPWYFENAPASELGHARGKRPHPEGREDSISLR